MEFNKMRKEMRECVCCKGYPIKCPNMYRFLSSDVPQRIVKDFMPFLSANSLSISGIMTCVPVYTIGGTVKLGTVDFLCSNI